MTIIERSQALVLTPIGQIEEHPDNPRYELGDLTDLTASIEAVGILEPLVLAPHHEDHDRLVLVAGHRRLAAAVEAGMTRVPCVICPDLITEARQLEVMLAENLQRSDLTPLDEAGAYARLKELGIAQRDLGGRVHRSQSHVSKRLSLLRLPDRARELLADGTISLQTALGLTALTKHPDRLRRALTAVGACADAGSDARVAAACKREFDQLAGEKAQKEREERRAAAKKEMAALRKRLVKKGLVDLDAIAEATLTADVAFDWNEWDECGVDVATAFEIGIEQQPSGDSAVFTVWYRPERDTAATAAPAEKRPGVPGADEERAAEAQATRASLDRQHRVHARANARDRVLAAVDGGDPDLDTDALMIWTLLGAFAEYSNLALLARRCGETVGEDWDDDDWDDDDWLRRLWHDPDQARRAALHAALDWHSGLPAGLRDLVLAAHGGYTPSAEEQAAIDRWLTPPAPDVAAVDPTADEPTPAEPWNGYSRHTPKMIRGILDKTPTRAAAVHDYEMANRRRTDILNHAQTLLT